MYGIKAELMNYISKSLSILAAALFMVLARAAVIVRAQAAESAKPVALEGVMEKLERDMQAVIGAISKEDWTMVAQPAPKIARRAKPPLLPQWLHSLCDRWCGCRKHLYHRDRCIL